LVNSNFVRIENHFEQKLFVSIFPCQPNYATLNHMRFHDGRGEWIFQDGEVVVEIVAYDYLFPTF
jgi:hypothetical protein